ncbi:FtsX-like permease family protein [candidate division KSB1 bacterium]
MHNFHTYVQLEQGVSAENVKQKLVNNGDRYLDEGTDLFKALVFTPLPEVHMTHVRGNLEPAFERKYVYIFTVVAFIILLIACVNFMNLSTARSAKRSKEVGLRKVVGARRIQLIRQFLGETIFLSFISLIFALGIVTLLTPSFNNWTGAGIEIGFTDLSFLGGLAILTLFVGLFSGSYSSFFMSGVKPVVMLRGISKLHFRNPLFRNALVFLQFSISIILITVTIVIARQLDFLKNMDLGWDHEQIVNVRLIDSETKLQAETIKAELRKSPNIINATTSTFLPSSVSQRHGVWWEGKQDDQSLDVWVFFIDDNFFDTFNMEIVQGRQFRKNAGEDEDGYIINEATIREIGWENPIGKKFTAFWEEGERPPIVGVAKDFNFRSLHHKIEPCLFYLNTGGNPLLSIRVQSDNISGTLEYIEEVIGTFQPGIPFEYYFMDEEFDKLYKSEIRMGNTISVFTVIAVFIACLGLFGLAAFIAEQRTKEVGIRKVLGASAVQVMMCLSRDTARCIIAANVLAWPASYFILRRWLQGFEYKVGIGIDTLIIAGLLAFLIAALTISYQVLKAAFANPADSLRYE